MYSFLCPLMAYCITSEKKIVQEKVIMDRQWLIWKVFSFSTVILFLKKSVLYDGVTVYIYVYSKLGQYVLINTHSYEYI